MTDLTDRPDPLVPAEVDLRADAAAAGKRRYFSGKACPSGHVAERYTLNGYCVVCQQIACRSNRRKLREALGAAA